PGKHRGSFPAREVRLSLDGAQDRIDVRNKQRKPGKAPGVRVLVVGFSACRQIRSSAQSSHASRNATAFILPEPPEGRNSRGGGAYRAGARTMRCPLIHGSPPWKRRNCIAAA